MGGTVTILASYKWIQYFWQRLGHSVDVLWTVAQNIPSKSCFMYAENSPEGKCATRMQSYIKQLAEWTAHCACLLEAFLTVWLLQSVPLGKLWKEWVKSMCTEMSGWLSGYTSVNDLSAILIEVIFGFPIDFMTGDVW
jgi:hypothetical protein